MISYVMSRMRFKLIHRIHIYRCPYIYIYMYIYIYIHTYVTDKRIYIYRLYTDIITSLWYIPGFDLCLLYSCLLSAVVCYGFVLLCAGPSCLYNALSLCMFAILLHAITDVCCVFVLLCVIKAMYNALSWTN